MLLSESKQKNTTLEYMYTSEWNETKHKRDEWKETEEKKKKDDQSLKKQSFKKV